MKAGAAGMSDDFAYVNARVRGMRGELLSPREIGGLLARPDLEETCSLLRQTPYGRDLQSALVRRPGIEGVEEGLRSNVERTFARLVAITTGRVREMVRIGLARWEVDCLKTLLRGKLRHATAAELLAACLPVGVFDEAALRELARQEDAGGVIDLLRLWGYGPARKMRKAWRRNPRVEDLQRLEMALERSSVEESLGRLEEYGSEGDGLRGFLRLQVDFRNVLTVLRLLKARSPASKAPSFFLGGGRFLSRDSFELLASRDDVPQAVDALGSSRLSLPFRETLPGYRSTGRLSLFERAAYRGLLGEARSLARLEPLGAGLAVGYIWAKINEVKNLRLICRAWNVGLPRPDLEAELTVAPS
jgi:vacuolar-type H+-ATPase subunit C/Vma6